MIKLKKPRGFSASKDTVTISIEGSDFDITNLLKSGIVHQNIVLLAYKDVWHEIEVLNFGIDDSNLKNFKKHVEDMNLTLADLGIVEQKKEIDYTLKHEDFLDLEKQFPAIPYFSISALYKWELEDTGRSGIYSLKQLLKILTERQITVQDWIKKADQQKKDIINSNTIKMNPDMQKENRIKELLEIGATESAASPGTFSAFGMEVTSIMIESLPDVAWTSVVNGIKALAPAQSLPSKSADQAFETSEPEASESEDATDIRINQVSALGFKFNDQTGNFENDGQIVEMNQIETMNETDWKIFMESYKPTEQAPPASVPAKKPVSLETIGKLTPDRIADLQGLKEKQIEIVKANPFIKITDAKTLKAAKAAKSALLKASTSTEKIEKDASSYLNTFKSMIKDFILPVAKLTRDPLKKQDDEIVRYETAEELRIQEENKKKLAKIKQRTDDLFAVPMAFDGSLYGIGAFYITPSQIEEATDEEFAVLLKKAQDTKILKDEETAAETKKDDALMAAAEQLAKFNGKSAEQNFAELTGKPWTPAADSAPKTVEAAVEMIDKVIPAETAETKGNDVEKFMDTSAPAATNTAAAPATSAPASGSAASTPAPQTHKLLKWMPATVYTMPHTDNKLMNALDLENLEHIEKSAYIKCRSFYAKGLTDTATEIRAILAAGGKSQQIKDFLDIIEQSK